MTNAIPFLLREGGEKKVQVFPRKGEEPLFHGDGAERLKDARRIYTYIYVYTRARDTSMFTIPILRGCVRGE